jgi:hypothetical protein
MYEMEGPRSSFVALPADCSTDLLSGVRVPVQLRRPLVAQLPCFASR